VLWPGAEGLVDQAHAFAERRADHGERRLAAAASVVLARPRPLDVEDDEGEGLLVAALALEQLVEPPPHLAGAIEAGVLLLRRRRLGPSLPEGADGGRGDRAELLCELRRRGGEERRVAPRHLRVQLAEQRGLQRGHFAGQLAGAGGPRRSGAYGGLGGHAETLAKQADVRSANSRYLRPDTRLVEMSTDR